MPAPTPQHLRRPVTVLLAAHNEAPTLSDVIQRCFKACPDGSAVLVVDDGSDDDSAAVAEASGAEVVRLRPNRGKGAAIRAGLDHVRHDVVVLLDADGQDHPEEIPALLEAAAQADLVIGSRWLGRFDEGAIRRLNWWGSVALRRIFNGLYGASVTDPFAGFRVFRRQLIRPETLTARRYDIEIDMLLDVMEQGGRVIEVPVRRSPRLHGRTGLDSFRDGGRMLRMMLKRRARR